MPLLEVKPVIAPYRGSANHQFTGGFDYNLSRIAETAEEHKRNVILGYVFKEPPAKWGGRRRRRRGAHPTEGAGATRRGRGTAQRSCAGRVAKAQPSLSWRGKGA